MAEFIIYINKVISDVGDDLKKTFSLFFLFFLNFLVLLGFLNFDMCLNNCYAMCESAKSAVLIEKMTGSIIYQKNAYQKLPMASTTKIMTALCAIESGKMDKTFTVDSSAVGVEGSSIYLAPNERLTLRELVYGLMLHSGNDAAVAIACAVSGNCEEFVKLMNDTAQKIGAYNTHFDNPNGLDGKTHYTTAYDLAIISAYALKNSEFAEIVSTKKINISNGDKGYDRVLSNHNKLLKMYEGCDGIKTGFTKKCGRCLASSATKDGMTLIAVTLNDPDDWNSHTAMLNYGFEHCKLKTVMAKGSFLGTCEVKGADIQKAKLYAESDVYMLVKDGIEPEYKMEYSLKKSITAPVEYGTKCGYVTIKINGTETKKIDAVIKCEIPPKQTNKSFDMFCVLFKEFVLNEF